MSNKNKLARFAEMKTLENVFEPELDDIKTGSYKLKKLWRKKTFKNNNPIVLELGCGKGEYSVGMAQLHPEKNFIGIDIKGSRMWNGAKQAIALELNNIIFLRTRIEFIENFFDKNEIDEIWITFPDPQPQSRRERKRLTAIPFLNRYRKFLKPKGVIHLKTDSIFLHFYTLDVIKEQQFYLLENTSELYANFDKYEGKEREILLIKTHYEKLFEDKGEKITYLKFTLN